MIEAIELTKRFHNNVQSSGQPFTAVDHLSLSVKAGEVLALLGPNGAGKTTTVRMLSAVLTPSGGRARVGGYDVVEQATQVRHVVGVLTEAPGLYLRMRALEYLDFFGRLYGLAPGARRARALQLIERFGMADSATRRLSEYSKGMRQKLALVRTMMHDPSVLLLDEPTSAMDPHSAKLVRDAIAEMRGDQRTIVICTHNLPEAEQLADRIAIIRRGQIIAHGSVDQLKADLLGAPLMELRLTGSLNGLLADLQQQVKLIEHGDTWLRYRPDDAQHDNPRLVRWLAERGADVLTLSQVPRSLEAVYLKVVEDEEV
ncbi:MAG: ABC transporter ATP-binding protein [Thermoflexales bacterium]|nr:ABC transporter ATP-binding protein [Thermoflexales bacterium]